nr:MAG TPA: hypothetical protein [Caudoviricetes sp.]
MIFNYRIVSYRPILWAVGVLFFFDLGGLSGHTIRT